MKTLIGGFPAVAARRRDKIAVVAGDTRLTFAELDRASAAVAARLVALGTRPGDLVGICLPRDADLLVALAGVWRAGAAYVPLDPAYPEARLDYLLRDCSARAVITWSGRPVALGGHCLVEMEPHAFCDNEFTEFAEFAAFTEVPVSGDDLAYVIYTSGSTGEPKGVAVTHGMVATLFAGLNAAGVYQTDPAVVGWNASVTFDVSVQAWARVLRGETVVVLSDDERRDPDQLAEAVRRYALTDLDITPSHLETALDALPPVLADHPICLFLAGEAVPPALWATLRRWHERGLANTMNLYGPTECTVYATIAFVHEHERPTIGRPLSGVGTHVVDDLLQPVPDGVAGELVLSGPQVARGYVGRPELTAERFVPAPDGAHLYRTGDRARMVAGYIEYLGRRDWQVKVRGYRIELGEVESVLAEVGDIDSAVVLVTPDGQSLAAAYTSHAGRAAESVRAALAQRLPAYMVPTVLRWLEALPLNTSGKADRAAVAALLATAPVVAETEQLTEQLTGPFEQLIATVWADVLGVATVGPHDDFFTQGGHSLLALRLVARVKQRLFLSVPSAAVFQHATVRALASHIEGMIRAELAASS